MVITCEQCQTRFNLDVSRVKGSIAKVRCSRCQHTFSVAVERDEAPTRLEFEEETRAPEPRRPRLEAMKAREEKPARLVLPPELEPPLPEIPEEHRPRPEPLRLPPLLMPHPSPWPRIISLICCLLGGMLIGGVVMWFWGYTWLAGHMKPKIAVETPPAVTEAPKKEALPPALLPPVTTEELRGLEVLGQEERYRGLSNLKGGPLLVIQGKVKNTTGQPRGPIQLKAVLTDPQHKTVNERVFYTGTLVFDDELQKLDPAEINHWLDTAGGRAQKLVVGPDEMQSFMVVFFGVPQNLTGYGYKLQVVKGPVVTGAR